MVLDTILQYGYLWTKVRVQGGALRRLYPLL